MVKKGFILISMLVLTFIVVNAHQQMAANDGAGLFPPGPTVTGSLAFNPQPDPPGAI